MSDVHGSVIATCNGPLYVTLHHLYYVIAHTVEFMPPDVIAEVKQPL